MFTVFTVPRVFMDGSISAYLNVCNITHSAVISQTSPFLLSTDEYPETLKMSVTVPTQGRAHFLQRW